MLNRDNNENQHNENVVGGSGDLSGDVNDIVETISGDIKSGDENNATNENVDSGDENNITE